MFKRHMPGEFHDCSWVFWSRHCSRKGARRVEERKKKTKMTKLDFHHFQVRHFSNNFEQSPCYCKMGQRQRTDLSVFGRIKIHHQAKHQRLNANTLYVAAILFFRSTLHREALPCLPNEEGATLPNLYDMLLDFSLQCIIRFSKGRGVPRVAKFYSNKKPTPGRG